MSIEGFSGVTDSQTLLLRLMPKHLSDNLTSLLSAPPSPQIIKQLAYLPPSSVSISHVGLKGCCARPCAPQQQLPTAGANPGVVPGQEEQEKLQVGVRWEFFMPWIVDSKNSTFDPDPTRPTLNTKMSPTRTQIYKLKSYPALLTNLPTILELHKTSTKSSYIKLTEIGQMLMVFGTDAELSAHLLFTSSHSSKNFPSYYPHGLSPPFHSILHTRFNDSHRFGFPHDHLPSEVQNVEVEIVEFLKDGNLWGKRRKRTEKQIWEWDSRGAIEEIVEEEVPYEPWMDDYGRSVGGVTFKEGERLEREHPENFWGLFSMILLLLGVEVGDKVVVSFNVEGD
ncbi:hypothetical protein TrLO_g11166 [Triparma laevis f. longispina]|uniref:TAFII55 protein conserved region domain-containing protein n=1 Tax=Triparma laevis f. longispina TaxID=1714387 RepID=A0A9W7FE70_9STRA|nr:hypothetical protein TrLO_g11166 [Triparma laevis f. longispina]